MPFKSDKQRRFLWSQKPEVAKKIAYANKGKLLGAPLSLGDEATDLARRNLARMKNTTQPAGATRPATGHAARQKGWGTRRDKVGEDVAAAIDFATDVAPVTGVAKDLYRAGAAAAAGDTAGAALNLGSAGLSFVPGGKIAGKVAKKGADKIRNFHGFERARQRVPDLVPDNPTIWNQINDDVFHGRNLKVGKPAQRGASASGKSSGTAYNASVMTPDGKELPVLVAPHARDKSKWHLITTRDRGRNNKDTSELGGRMYNKGGSVGGK